MYAITNKDGQLLNSEEGRQAKWKENFEAVLNREAPPNPPTDEQVEEGKLDIDTEPPTEEEIKRVVQTLNNWEGTRNRPDNSRTVEG